MQKIRIERTTTPKEKPGADNPLVFGTIFTDHMFIMDYEEGKGWFDPRIVPYGPVALDPSAMVFHYGQAMFEGLKAYRGVNGKTLLFRPDKNAERANRSNDRLCMPRIDPDFFLEAIKAIVRVDEDWI
ncbi:MAG: branched chain amino acid aminotransferase, partial [Lachnospiraceae bacterium]|nr:branched chain amino acid aminotransferase [Lachnospiraceae bacterium]